MFLNKIKAVSLKVIVMRRFVIAALAVLMIFTFASCKGSEDKSDLTSPPSESGGTEDAPDSAKKSASKTLVAYFSVTNNTERVAQTISESLGADLYEITPRQPYSEVDIDYNDPESRCSKENNDPAARPAISGELPNTYSYDVIYLGYPLWFGKAPKIMNTFIESLDLSGKTIIPFCTSASSDFGNSDDDLIAASEAAFWQEGKRFGAQATEDEVISWAKAAVK